MPIEPQIDTERHIVTLTCSGKIQLGELLELFSQYGHDPTFFECDLIVDTRNISELNLDSAELMQVAERSTRLPSTNANCKIAFVVDNEKIRTSTEFYASAEYLLPQKTREKGIFDSIELATEWLTAD